MKTDPNYEETSNPFGDTNAVRPSEWRPVWAAWLKKHRQEWVGETPVETEEGPISITNQTADHIRHVRQGENAALHFEAATRLRELLTHSKLAAVDPPKEGEKGAEEVHRRYAWMKFSDKKIRHVLLTIKRWNEASDKDTDTAYALEALEVKEESVTDGLITPDAQSDNKETIGNAKESINKFLSGIKPEHRYPNTNFEQSK